MYYSWHESLSCDVTSSSARFWVSRKSGRGGRWVHLNGGNSMAVSGLGCKVLVGIGSVIFLPCMKGLSSNFFLTGLDRHSLAEGCKSWKLVNEWVVRVTDLHRMAKRVLVKVWSLKICDRLWINHPFTATYVTWVQSSIIVIYELWMRALLIVFITTECVGLPLCNMRFLKAGYC